MVVVVVLLLLLLAVVVVVLVAVLVVVEVVVVVVAVVVVVVAVAVVAVHSTPTTSHPTRSAHSSKQNQQHCDFNRKGSKPPPQRVPLLSPLLFPKPRKLVRRV